MYSLNRIYGLCNLISEQLKGAEPFMGAPFNCWFLFNLDKDIKTNSVCFYISC
jgi:hypothetical protein